LEAISQQTQTLTGNVEATGESMTKMGEALQNGIKADDLDAVIGLADGFTKLGGETTTAATGAEKVATASGVIADALSKGATNTDAMTGAVASMNSGLGEVSSTMEGQMKTAQDNYKSKLDEVKKAEEDGVTQVDSTIEAKGKESAALGTWAVTVADAHGDAALAIQAFGTLSAEEQAIIIAQYGTKEEAARQSEATVLADYQAADDAFTAAITTGEADKQKVRDDAATKRKEAETQLGTDIATITSGFDTEALAAMKLQQLSVGNAEGAGLLDRLMKYQLFASNMKTKVDNGNTDIATSVDTFISDIDAKAATARTSGENVGDAMGKGIWKKLNEWLKPIVDKATQIVNDAIAAAKKAGEVNSPSKKMMREVGAPLGEGLIKGWEETIEPMKASISAGVDKVIGVGGISAKDASFTAKS